MKSGIKSNKKIRPKIGQETKHKIGQKGQTKKSDKKIEQKNRTKKSDKKDGQKGRTKKSDKI